MSYNKQISLYIHSLEIENFRQYLGKHRIEFSTDPKKNFTVIRGGNGFGKTNFLNAIYWCLYRKDIKNNKNKKLPIFSLEAIKNTSIGKFIQVRVCINLGTEQTVTHIIERKVTARKVDDSTETYESEYGEEISKALIIESEDTKFSRWSEMDKMWMDFHDNNKKKDNDFTREVNNLIPEVLSEFIFFDGEKLENFFNFDQQKQSRIKTALENISQLPLLDDLIKHLGSVEDKYVAKSKQIGGQDSKTLADLIEQHKKTIEDYDTKIIEDVRVLNRDTINLENINKQILDLNIEEITNKVTQQKKLESEKEIIKKDLLNLNQMKVDKILSNFYSVLLSRAIIETKKIIDEDVDKGKLPPPVKAKICEDILIKNECICGTNIMQNLAARKKIQDLLNWANLEPLQKPIVDVYDDLNEFLNFIDIKQQINEITGQISKRQDDAYKIDVDIKNITIDLSGHDEPNVRSLKQIQEGLKTSIDRIKERKVLNDHLRKEEETLLTKIRISHNYALQKEKRNRILKQKIERCQRIMDILSNTKKELIEEFRELVEKDTKEVFFNLIYKQRSFQDVRINKDYSISVISNEYEAVGSLSAGESLFLAISFISALKKIAGIRMPLVMDSPLGKIDVEPKILCAKYLPLYSQQLGIQITMLLTKSEYDTSIKNEDGEEIGSFRQFILPYVGKEYRMNFDDDKQMVEVTNYDQ